MIDKGKIGQPSAEGHGHRALRRISQVIPLETLKEDLERFRVRALDVGASMAEVMPANWVNVDERVRLKCSVPLCGYFGKCAHCPPNSPDVDFMRKALGQYSSAVLFAIDVPVEDYADRNRVKTRSGWFRKNYEIGGEVETMAFASGYYLTAAFSQGSCKAVLCGEADGCRVLEGKGCANPLKSRPSMESVGIDAFGLVARVGWDIYPIYRSVDFASVPRALSAGIVFVY